MGTLGSSIILGVPPVDVPIPTVALGVLQFCLCAALRLEPPGCEPLPDGEAVDWPGVGPGVGPVPLGTRLSVVPVPGVPELDGKVNDWPGVGAGVGPVPLGTELPGDAPEVDPVAPPEAAAPPLVPPELLDPPLCALAATQQSVRHVAKRKGIGFSMAFSKKCMEKRAPAASVPTPPTEFLEQCALSTQP